MKETVQLGMGSSLAVTGRERLLRTRGDEEDFNGWLNCKRKKVTLHGCCDGLKFTSDFKSRKTGRLLGSVS